jgi:hypothetical protein
MFPIGGADILSYARGKGAPSALTKRDICPYEDEGGGTR